MKAGCAPRLFLRTTHERAPPVVDIEELKSHAIHLSWDLDETIRVDLCAYLAEHAFAN
jgi:hypothetical protein